jgi:hypothetical protein
LKLGQLNRGRFGRSPVFRCGPGYLIRHSDSLRAGRSKDRIPVRARFSAPIQTDPGAHPVSSTTLTGSLQGIKRPEVWRLTTHPLLMPRSNEEYSYTYTPSLCAFMACYRMNLYFLHFGVPVLRQTDLRLAYQQ